MNYRHSNTITSSVSSPFGGMFATSVSRFSGGVFDAVDAVVLLTKLGYRILPPPKPPGRKRKDAQAGSFRTPEMKAHLLVAFLIEADKATRRLTDKQILKRIKTRGGFERWGINSLAVELSRARKWAESKDGQTWIEHEARRVAAVTASAPNEKAADPIGGR